MNQYIFIGIILILASIFLMVSSHQNFTNYIAPFASASHANWWEKRNGAMYGYPHLSYWESFQNPTNSVIETDSDSNAIMDFPPGKPGPSDVYNNQPYHLLGDIMQPPRVKESVSCVNSRSCYATDFNRMIEKTGTFRQLTNNYKRSTPDSCSAPNQELVLNFYKTEAMAIPENHTGKSVSEA